MGKVHIQHVFITGRVQGVGYRAWTVGQARKLGLSGWVRNRQDGTVEAVFAGPEDRVYEMLQRCEDGPLVARVDQVRAKEMTPPDAPLPDPFASRSIV